MEVWGDRIGVHPELRKPAEVAWLAQCCLACYGGLFNDNAGDTVSGTHRATARALAERAKLSQFFA